MLSGCVEMLARAEQVVDCCPVISNRSKVLRTTQVRGTRGYTQAASTKVGESDPNDDDEDIVDAERVREWRLEPRREVRKGKPKRQRRDAGKGEEGGGRGVVVVREQERERKTNRKSGVRQMP